MTNFQFPIPNLGIAHWPLRIGHWALAIGHWPMVIRDASALLVNEPHGRRCAAVAAGIGLLDDQIRAFHRQLALLLDAVAAEIQRGRDRELVAFPARLRHLLLRCATAAGDGVRALRSIELVGERHGLITLHARDRQCVLRLRGGERLAESRAASATATATSATATSAAGRSRSGRRVQCPLTREVGPPLRLENCECKKYECRRRYECCHTPHV